MKKIILLSLLTLIAFSSKAEPMVQSFEIQSSYENWQLAGNETMGMVRLGLRQQFGQYWNAGVDAYTAVKGERGGFITLGLAGGFEYPLSSQIALEAGLFVGAGGGRGGYELTGGGLMLRENIGVKYYLPAYGSISVGMSHVDFPNGGTVKSQQMYVGYNLPFNALLEPSTMRPGRRYLNDLPSASYQAETHQFSIKARQLKVSDGTLTDANQSQENFGLLGAEWRTFVSPNWFLKAETAGAMQGNSRGYMHILAGGGYQYPITKKLSAYSSLAVGGGGGGSVNTGGGLLWDGTIGAQYFLNKNWFADLSLSKLWAASTSFESKGVGIQIGYQFGARNNYDNGSAATFDSHPLRIRAVQQQYKKANEDWRNRPNQDVGNLGVQVDYFLNPNWYLTGQGLGAHSGDAGAYMTGLVGSGLRTKITKNTFIEVEGLIGAAGGGGLNTGSGLIYQANLGLGYQLSKSLEIQGNVGEAKAVNGNFRAHVLGFSLAYKFNALTAR